MKSAVTLWKWPTHPNRKHFLKTWRAFETLQLKGVSNSLRPRANQRIFKPRRGKCNEQDVAEDIRFSHFPLKFTYSLCHKPDMSKGAVIVLYESNILIKKKKKWFTTTVFYHCLFLLLPAEILPLLRHLWDGSLHSLAHSSRSYFLFITTTAYDLSSDLRLRGSLKKPQ